MRLAEMAYLKKEEEEEEEEEEEDEEAVQFSLEGWRFKKNGVSAREQLFVCVCQQTSIFDKLILF